MGFWDYYNLYRDVQAYQFPSEFEQMLTGRTQMRNTQKSVQAQISYEEYLRQGNERAIADFYRNVPNRTIRYPELSYAGQIARSNTAITRAGLDYDNAVANYYGNLPYRSAGLYGVTGRLSRTI